MVQEDGQISEAELAAFADGLLSPRRRAQVAACIERSPELDVLVGEQRAALAGARLSRDELLTLAAWNGSIDIARIDTLSPPLHRLAA